MKRTMLKSKIHRATATQCNLNYEGSCAIDRILLEAADIREFEQIDIYNINNGERFSTYALIAPEGSGIIALNGAAARKAAVGDLLIIASYATFEEDELDNYHPDLIYVDQNNRCLRQDNQIPLERVLP